MTAHTHPDARGCAAPLQSSEAFDSFSVCVYTKWSERERHGVWRHGVWEDLAAEVTVTWNPASRRRTATDRPITPAPTTAADGREDGDEDEDDAALAPAAVFVAEMTALLVLLRLRRGALFGLLSALPHGGRRHGAVPTHMPIVAVFGADMIVTRATPHHTADCCCKPRRRSFVPRGGSSRGNEWQRREEQRELSNTATGEKKGTSFFFVLLINPLDHSIGRACAARTGERTVLFSAEYKRKQASRPSKKARRKSAREFRRAPHNPSARE